MKVLYISSPSFLDLDLSFVKSMSSKVEMYFLLDLYPCLMNATALELDSLFDEIGVYRADSYDGLKKYSDFLDFDKTYAINRISDKWYSLSNFKLQLILWKFINEIKPDVIHFNNHVYSNHFYLFLYGLNRILINVHDPFPHSDVELSLKNRLQINLNNKLVKNHLIFNKVLKDDYIKHYNLGGSNVYDSFLGVYDYLNVECEAYGFKHDILFFGRITKYKGIDDLMAAFSVLLESVPDARLTIAGAGDLWFDCADYAVPESQLNIVNRFIATEELSAMLRQAKIVVCPYKDATQSGVVMSAYALNKPVVATRVGGLVEMIDDGVTGLLVEPNKPDDLAEAMKKLLENDQIRNEMELAIGASYKDGSKSWNAMSDEVSGIYSEIYGKL